MNPAEHELLEGVMRCALARTRGMKEKARIVVVGKAGVRWLREQGLTEGVEVYLDAPDDPSHLVQTLRGRKAVFHLVASLAAALVKGEAHQDTTGSNSAARPSSKQEP